MARGKAAGSRTLKVLTVSTPIPEAHQDAARAQGKARFEQFVEQLGRHLLRGRDFVTDDHIDRES